ncbi:metal ABC transporter permease [Campylobacter fetus]|uniref:metal ABC transporter permease n=1 Tax=Campylobacter fetus TaxID=196 RepID=UPI0003C2B20A|nr:metal ABC transporter permease [Campylobacter fetus]AGZ81582.1 putative Mn2+/Fe2+ ABC transporter, permease protein [Campylobacter fetus subsp. testudinum 03-427]EAI4321441.1 metal ABC transporter permease [Campylobacter fetus]EAI4390697.1 metal ABC transporter permease [Campylobacter fetus]OCS07658.1 iron ABC transporter permease AfeC [Campylobacter fetus subsp. testudinum]OCS09021.1 iron ABC transporter permease AfeC [Campylobacter fetus subsp. testudinum]
MEWLIEPFNYSYIVKAHIVSLFLCAFCGFLSCFLILKSYSLLADALSHSVTPGVVIAYMMSFSYTISSFICGLFALCSMGLVSRSSRLKTDTIIGVTFSSFFALSLFLVSIYPVSIKLETIFLGDVLSLNDSEVYELISLIFILFLFLIFSYQKIKFIFFDELGASSVGINVRFYKILFFMLLCFCTVASLKTVGAILVTAMLITPAASASMISFKFNQRVILATLFAGFSGFFGVYISYFLDTYASAMIVLTQILIFIVCFLYKRIVYDRVFA